MSNQDADHPSMGGGALAHFRSGETAAVAVAAKAKAMVEARRIMAMQRPRDMDVVRQKVINECRRPSFANNPSTWYRKPIGKGVEGLGIRFVEAALRCMTNVTIEVTTSYEDDAKRIVCVTVEDLEATVPWSQEVSIDKTVERSKPLDDGSFISKRLNSKGNWVFKVPADDDSLLNKVGALVSKAIRTLGLRLIPGDIQDEAEAIILEVRRADAAVDPDAKRKALVDAFAGLGIAAAQLIEYLGHPLGQTTPDEIVELRGLYGSLRDGEATWRAVMENKRAMDAESGRAATETAAPAATSGKGTSKLRDALIPNEAPASAQEAPASDPVAPPAEAAPAAAEAQAAPAAKPRGGKRRSYAQILESFNAASSLDELDALLPEIAALPEAQRHELAAAAAKQRGAFQ